MLLGTSLGFCQSGRLLRSGSSVFRSVRRFDANNRSSIDLITSTKSTTVKRIQNLLTKRKKRRMDQQSVVEGPRMIFDLLANSHSSSLIQQVIVDQDRHDWIERIQQDFPQTHVCAGTCDVLKAVSDTTTPQGIVAIVAIPAAENNSKLKVDSQLHLLLDGISDPGNMGTILRSAAAVGVSSILLVGDCCDPWNPKALRSAMGTTFQIPRLQQDIPDWTTAQHIVQEELHNVQQIYAATMVEEGATTASLPYYGIDWIQKNNDSSSSLLIIGSEGNGLSNDIRQSVHNGDIGAVHVPMQPGVESLNAAVCSSIIMFEYKRQHDMANQDI